MSYRQSTGFGFPAAYSKPPRALHFTHSKVRVSVLLCDSLERWDGEGGSGGRGHMYTYGRFDRCVAETIIVL